MVKFTTAQSDQDLHQILALQQSNLPKNLSNAEAQNQGFVTVHHDWSTLKAMNETYSHIVAKQDNQVVAYALVMLPEFADSIPVLRPMFNKIDGLTFAGGLLRQIPYFVMGQVCVAKSFRGQGVFAGLYKTMKREMVNDFRCVITEIATRNTRSRRAHEKVGFETLHIYKTSDEEWAIVGWNWT